MDAVDLMSDFNLFPARKPKGRGMRLRLDRKLHGFQVKLDTLKSLYLSIEDYEMALNNIGVEIDEQLRAAYQKKEVKI